MKSFYIFNNRQQHDKANRIICSICWQCKKPINKLDDAEICIECGGRNGRINEKTENGRN